jgi:hypothetical protein
MSIYAVVVPVTPVISRTIGVVADEAVEPGVNDR